jgi:hypothetical protein
MSVPHPTGGNSSGKKPLSNLEQAELNRIRLEELQNVINAAPPAHYRREPAKKKKKKVPIETKIYRVMFVIGMILGAFLSLLLPIHYLHFDLAQRHITIPFSVVKLNYWERVGVYIFMVIANGFLWSKLAVDFYITYIKRKPRYDPIFDEKASLPDDGQQSKMYKLD